MILVCVVVHDARPVFRAARLKFLKFDDLFLEVEGLVHPQVAVPTFANKLSSAAINRKHVPFVSMDLTDDGNLSDSDYESDEDDCYDMDDHVDITDPAWRLKNSPSVLSKSSLSGCEAMSILNQLSICYRPQIWAV